MNYLQLCQELVSELGLAGGAGPTSVTDQRGELKNVTRWVRDSCLWVDNLWDDWKYHWCEYTGTIAENGRVPTAAAFTVGHWDRESFWLNKSAQTAQQFRYIPWEEFRNLYETGNALAQRSTPNILTVRPDATLRVYPTSNALHSVTAEYWRRPRILTLDTDVPLMPEQYQRIIMARAAIMYGNREDAPEIISGMEAEYVDLLEKLQSDQAPSFAADRKSSPDVMLQGAIPGAADGW